MYGKQAQNKIEIESRVESDCVPDEPLDTEMLMCLNSTNSHNMVEILKGIKFTSVM